LLEPHCAQGFAVVKFYPKLIKSNPARFQLRGISELGFEFGVKSVKIILVECALLMRDYLEENPDNFVGYIGQTDRRDNKVSKPRETAQRADIYNLYTNSMFLYPKYKLSSKKMFLEVNLRLIRKVRSKQENRITKIQKSNYNSFLYFFESNKDKYLELMTKKTRSQYE